MLVLTIFWLKKCAYLLLRVDSTVLINSAYKKKTCVCMKTKIENMKIKWNLLPTLTISERGTSNNKSFSFIPSGAYVIKGKLSWIEFGIAFGIVFRPSEPILNWVWNRVWNRQSQTCVRYLLATLHKIRSALTDLKSPLLFILFCINNQNIFASALLLYNFFFLQNKK